MKNHNRHPVYRVVLTTGIASVVTQLLTIREFLTQFQGNEIVIALILFSWLILGGVGTRLAHFFSSRIESVSATILAWLSFLLTVVSPMQILAIRLLRDYVFTQGASVGFYATLAFIFILIAPYALLIGFVLPYSLFVLRRTDAGFPGVRIYMLDNLGDIMGGALFTFGLVFLFTPMPALLIANLPLLAASYFLLPAKKRYSTRWVTAVTTVILCLTIGVLFENTSLAPRVGVLVDYRESLHGRITIHKNRDQLTLFNDGIPSYSSHNIMVAEETIHYPLAQLAAARQILLISAEGGVMREIRKHRPQRVDYVELNPEITRALTAHGMIESFPELNVIHQDGRTFLQTTPKRYDAIIVNLPEPDTFQINRFYTEYFFKLARSRLTSDGILCFFMKGYSNYLAEPQRQKISSLYNSVAGYFSHVTLLPGHKICFLCRDLPIDTDIPALLSHKGVDSDYIQGFYYGNITAERISYLNALVDPTIPKNRDISPQLMRIMFDQWFEKFTTSPSWFFTAIAVLGAVYLIRINRTEFVLFSTGCMTMGSEILVIFAFQIYFGYIYFQIGVIVTIFLTGLLPGALWGNRLATDAKRLLALTDGAIIILMGIFLIALQGFGSRLPVAFFLMFGFSISLLCGCQFPIALRYQGDDNPAATRFFSADLIGAAAGTLVTSMVLIPYLGFLKAAGAFILLKSMSLLAIGVVHE